MDYETWMYQVDQKVMDILGVSVHDLADWLSYDAWESGATPTEGAIEALRSDDLVGMVFGSF